MQKLCVLHNKHTACEHAPLSRVVCPRTLEQFHQTRVRVGRQRQSTTCRMVVVVVVMVVVIVIMCLSELDRGRLVARVAWRIIIAYVQHLSF